jgi:cytochrome c oxidase subunit 5a
MRTKRLCVQRYKHLKTQEHGKERRRRRHQGDRSNPKTPFPSSRPTMQRSPAVLSTLLRARAVAPRVAPAFARASSGGQETFEQFTDRYVSFFQAAQDLYEVQRGLNNCFSHDLVPAPSVVEAALRAARRVDSYATAVRIFEGIGEKVENKRQYQAYLDELKPVREELGTYLPLDRLCPLAEVFPRHPDEGRVVQPVGKTHVFPSTSSPSPFSVPRTYPHLE